MILAPLSSARQFLNVNNFNISVSPDHLQELLVRWRWVCFRPKGPGWCAAYFTLTAPSLYGACEPDPGQSNNTASPSPPSSSSSVYREEPLFYHIVLLGKSPPLFWGIIKRSNRSLSFCRHESNDSYEGCPDWKREEERAELERWCAPVLATAESMLGCRPLVAKALFSGHQRPFRIWCSEHICCCGWKALWELRPAPGAQLGCIVCIQCLSSSHTRLHTALLEPLEQLRCFCWFSRIFF